MKILNMKKETDFNHLNLFSMAYTDTEGSAKSWIFASRSREPSVAEGKPHAPDAVVVVPFHIETEKLVVIREFRVPLGGYQYGFPAGLVDAGETVEAAAKRELKEETGLDLVTVTRKSPPVYSSSGMTDESVSMVYGQVRGEASTRLNEASEDIEVILLSRDQALELLEKGDTKFDVKSWILLSTFARNGIV